MGQTLDTIVEKARAAIAKKEAAAQSAMKPKKKKKKAANNADESTIKADFKNGVLNLTVKKTASDEIEEQARRIPITPG